MSWMILSAILQALHTYLIVISAIGLYMYSLWAFIIKLKVNTSNGCHCMDCKSGNRSNVNCFILLFLAVGTASTSPSSIPTFRLNKMKWEIGIYKLTSKKKRTMVYNGHSETSAIVCSSSISCNKWSYSLAVCWRRGACSAGWSNSGKAHLV